MPWIFPHLRGFLLACAFVVNADEDILTEAVEPSAGSIGDGVLTQPSFTSSHLDFLECEGPFFDPVWVAFKHRLPQLITRGVEISESVASHAADLLDAVEEEDLASKVGAFSARMNAEVSTQELGGFCLFGVVAAYAVIAIHLDKGSGEVGLPPTSKSSIARALLLLAKKQRHDFLESSSWPLRSLDLVAMLEGEDAEKVRGLRNDFQLPCHLSLNCQATRDAAENIVEPPPPPLSAAWPAKVAAIGLHTTSTMEVVTALRDAVAEAWGRGGAGGAPFEVQYAGHPCPTHAGSVHQCQMRCELFGTCDAGADAVDPLADFIAGAVDVSKFEERESYSLSEARVALRWVPKRLAPLKRADLFLCTFPTVLCLLLHEFFPEKPLLFVAIANPLFAAPGCTRREDSTTRECVSDETREYLVALRSMLTDPGNLVRGVAAYSVTAALVGYQVGVRLPLAGKAGRYLPAEAMWRQEHTSEVLIARTRFLDTVFGSHLRSLLTGFAQTQSSLLKWVFQQEVGAYMSYEDISAFMAVVIFPQDLGLHKFTEHYAMAMPIWMPDREWAYRLQMWIPWGMVSYSGIWDSALELRREAATGGEPFMVPPSAEWPEEDFPSLSHPPFFNAQSVPYPLAPVAFWYEFSEFVAYPHVQMFDSVPSLLSSLTHADFAAISWGMRRFRAELWRTTRAVYAASAGQLAGMVASAESVVANVATG